MFTKVHRAADTRKDIPEIEEISQQMAQNVTKMQLLKGQMEFAVKEGSDSEIFELQLQAARLWDRVYRLNQRAETLLR